MTWQVLHVHLVVAVKRPRLLWKSTPCSPLLIMAVLCVAEELVAAIVMGYETRKAGKISNAVRIDIKMISRQDCSIIYYGWHATHVRKCVLAQRSRPILEGAKFRMIHIFLRLSRSIILHSRYTM
jgi:hypothetical protein